jgi:hypothetical protein
MPKSDVSVIIINSVSAGADVMRPGGRMVMSCFVIGRYRLRISDRTETLLSEVFCSLHSAFRQMMDSTLKLITTAFSHAFSNSSLVFILSFDAI